MHFTERLDKDEFDFKVFPLYKFSGTERHIGQQYGEECREEIKHTINWWCSVHANTMPDKSVNEIKADSKKFETSSICGDLPCCSKLPTDVPIKHIA